SILHRYRLRGLSRADSRLCGTFWDGTVCLLPDAQPRSLDRGPATARVVVACLWRSTWPLRCLCEREAGPKRTFLAEPVLFLSLGSQTPVGGLPLRGAQSGASQNGGSG